MKKSGATLQHMELKYCERCGGLWLRREGSERVYCLNCLPLMNEIPAGRNPLPARVRLPIGKLDMEGSCARALGYGRGER